MSHNNLMKMIEISKTYCQLIESIEQNQQQQQQQQMFELVKILQQLQTSVQNLSANAPSQGNIPEPDLERRYELFHHLKSSIGDSDHYHMEFDDPNEIGTGSLADDLTDIYCELQLGLFLINQGQQDYDNAYYAWIKGYQLHWHSHVMDAIAHLQELGFESS